MKKNGFTLIELIATIVLIALIATVILINMVGVKDNQDIQQAKRFKQQVEEAACAYVDSSEFTEQRNIIKSDLTKDINITLDTLVSNRVALIEPELKDTETNCTAQGEKDRVYVRVYFTQEANGIKVKHCDFTRTSEEVC